MNGRFFLDTNVFVYSFDRGAPTKAARATALIRRAIETRQGIVSYQVVQEFIHVALRRFAEPMSFVDADQYLKTIFRPLLTVHSSQNLYTQALQLASTYSLSWYDALIAASAVEGRCALLYSEDFQHGQRLGSVRVENPFL
jgi:predicted nucleic acid-binding protein